jgi:hypothetical protein
MREIHGRLLGVTLSLALAAGFPMLSHAAEDPGLYCVPRPGFASDGDAQPAVKPIVPATVSEERHELSRATIRNIIEKEASVAGLPADIAEAVVRIESGYDPAVVGSVGEIGLMQVRPGTAALLGFRGDISELAKPDINIHYGVTYLGRAWKLANGDICRALMKYRAGLAEEIMTPLSVAYCNRARDQLATLSSPFANIEKEYSDSPIFAQIDSRPNVAPPLPTSVYATLRRGTPAASQAFWKVQEARVRIMSAMVRAKWNKRVAMR